MPTEYYMSIDLRQVIASDGIILLPNWSSSKGAVLEALVARECGVPIHLFVSKTATLGFIGPRLPINTTNLLEQILTEIACVPTD